MRTLLICFSQTGNTRAVAERIRAGILDQDVSCDASCDQVGLTDVDVATLPDYDLVGIGYPVFYYQEPLNVRDFVERLPRLAGAPWFVFCSHGAAIGAGLHSAVGRLRAKEADVIGWHDCYADATVPFFPYPTLTTGHPDDTDLAEARAFGREIVVRRRRVADGDRSVIPELAPVPPEWLQLAHRLDREFLSRRIPTFRITADCTHCGECVAACPVGGIDPDSDPPRIQQPCCHCLNCQKSCPAAAIEADWAAWEQQAPPTYARYRELLDTAVAAGRFRWHVDPDAIDFGNPLHRQRVRSAGGAGRTG